MLFFLFMPYHGRYSVPDTLLTRSYTELVINPPKTRSLVIPNWDRPTQAMPGRL